MIIYNIDDQQRYEDISQLFFLLFNKSKIIRFCIFAYFKFIQHWHTARYK